MPGLTIRSAVAAFVVAASSLGWAATAAAAPGGPCDDVPYVGVCQSLGGSDSSPSQQGMGDVYLPSGSGLQNVG